MKLVLEVVEWSKIEKWKNWTFEKRIQEGGKIFAENKIIYISTITKVTLYKKLFKKNLLFLLELLDYRSKF